MFWSQVPGFQRFTVSLALLWVMVDPGWLETPPGRKCHPQGVWLCVQCRGHAVQGGAPPVIRWFINPIMIFGLYRVILAMKLSKPTYKPG